MVSIPPTSDKISRNPELMPQVGGIEAMDSETPRLFYILRPSALRITLVFKNKDICEKMWQIVRKMRRDGRPVGPTE